MDEEARGHVRHTADKQHFRLLPTIIRDEKDFLLYVQYIKHRASHLFPWKLVYFFCYHPHMESSAPLAKRKAAINYMCKVTDSVVLEK